MGEHAPSRARLQLAWSAGDRVVSPRLTSAALVLGAALIVLELELPDGREPLISSAGSTGLGRALLDVWPPGRATVATAADPLVPVSTLAAAAGSVAALIIAGALLVAAVRVATWALQGGLGPTRPEAGAQLRGSGGDAQPRATAVTITQLAGDVAGVVAAVGASLSVVGLVPAAIRLGAAPLPAHASLWHTWTARILLTLAVTLGLCGWLDLALGRWRRWRQHHHDPRRSP